MSLANGDRISWSGDSTEFSLDPQGHVFRFMEHRHVIDKDSGESRIVHMCLAVVPGGVYVEVRRLLMLAQIDFMDDSWESEVGNMLACESVTLCDD